NRHAVAGQLPQLTVKFVIFKAESCHAASQAKISDISGKGQPSRKVSGSSIRHFAAVNCRRHRRHGATPIGATPIGATPMSQVHTIGPDFTGSRLFKVIAFIYGMASYLVFFVTILYAIGFVMGLVVPKTIDTGTSKSVTEAVVVNLLLMSLFAVQHSVMARRGFKAWWTQYVPKPIERSTYVLAASSCLLLLFWQWRPIPTVVWQLTDPDLAAVVAMISLGGWVLVFTSTFLINHFELFGLSQVASHLVDKQVPEPR